MRFRLQNVAKETWMEIAAAVAEWVTWLAAGGAAAIAFASVARVLEAVLDLELR